MINQNNKVTIVMATYNGEYYLSEQIESILSQTYTNWELYIHDDDSKDATINIINHYVSKDSRINFLDDSLSFKSATLNFKYLIDNINVSEYLMLSDQDDIWLPDKIKTTLEVMLAEEIKQQGKPILVHTDLKVVDSKLNIINSSFYNYMNIDIAKDSLNRLLVRNVVTGCTLMINKPLHELVQKMPKQAIVHDWWIALNARLFGQIVFIKKPTLLYRQHDHNSIGANKNNSIKQNLQYMYNYNRKEIEAYIRQCTLLYEIHSSRMSHKDKQLCYEFMNLLNYNILKRKYIMIKRNFLYQNVFQNLGLFIKL